MNRIQQFFAWMLAHQTQHLKDYIDMKLADIKAAIAKAAKDNTEAFAEIGTRLAALQKQIDDLIAGQTDPDVTDEAFLADLETLKVSAQQLADIVPNVPVA